jgi:transcription initiation factor TFIID TATA-box-binding protein
VVATYNFKAKIRLKDVAMRMANTEYSPQRFSAVIIRIRNPKATGLLFESGKMVCTGCKSKKESLTATRKLCRAIVQIMNEESGKKKGSNDNTAAPKVLKYTKTSHKIQNMTCLTDFKFPIRLEGLAIQFQQLCTYEPEIFPGLIFRMADPKVVLLIFVSGKVVITGAKKREDLEEAVEKIKVPLHMFKKATFVLNPTVSKPTSDTKQIASTAAPTTTTTTSTTSKKSL